ncbi:unnamed protein product [Amoebophrya sp. A120]|nr:unnamed protein product [Amoebophrya sp. A120]|eukprot:GSA120T00012681001.1
MSPPTILTAAAQTILKPSRTMEKIKHLPAALLDSVDGFVFDCDGVLWRAGELCDPRIPAVLQQLRDLKKKVFFVTNNSTKSRATFLAKLNSLGITASPEEFYTAGFACAEYIRLYEPRLLSTHNALLIGMHGLEEELKACGVNVIGGPSDQEFEKKMQHFLEESVGNAMEKGIFAMHNLEIPKNVGAVVCGFDPRINYFKIQTAQLCLNAKYNLDVPDCKFIATNPDAVAHITPTQEWAGNGCCVGAIKGCTGREPSYTGKPSSLLLDILCSRHSMERSRMVMVGDRLDTDILFGSSNGMKTVLVLSGVTTEEEAKATTDEMRPDFYMDGVADFFPAPASA